MGKNKTALIDTVNPGFEDALMNKISQVLPLESIDYVIMNHAEPDHASGIPTIMKAANKAKVVATQLGVNMAGVFFDVPADRRMIVKEGDTLELGDKTLKFIEAPWLHWPETMFTFSVEDRFCLPAISSVLTLLQTDSTPTK